MFDGLKKKFSSFIDSLSKKEAEKQPVEEKKILPEVKVEPAVKVNLEPIAEAKVEIKKESKPEFEPKAQIDPHAESDHEERRIHQIITEAPEKKIQEDAAKSAEVHATMGFKSNETIKEKPIQAEAPIPHIRLEAKVTPQEAPAPNPSEHKINPVKEAKHEEHRQKIEEAVQRKEPKISTVTKIKGFFLGHVRISENDADPFIESLKLGLLQSDVNYDVAEKISDSIRKNLVGREVSSRNIEADIRQGIRASIMGVLSKSSGIRIIERIRQKKNENQLPYKILFVGPNGAGKTTTMAKMASMLLANNITCVLSASDTFRAAAIEQTAHHANKLGINAIKGTYGSDPASVAFDAIAHAKAHGIMVVLIDSAGRQETNKSLIEELKKISRVTAPDLKIFIGESISGNALLDQVKAINGAVKLDGIILTKLDVDAKGGNTLSILSDTTIPILYFGTGEKYTDMMPYDPQFIVDNILPNN